jgi:uncharacterized cupredoxin-like copper-binding protein
MKHKVYILLRAVFAITVVTGCVSAQQSVSAICTAQATVVPAVTLRTTVNLENSSSNSLVPRTGMFLSGEGVIRLKVESAEKPHEVTIDLQHESKELKEKTFSRINKVRIEHLSS